MGDYTEALVIGVTCGVIAVIIGCLTAIIKAKKRNKKIDDNDE